MILKNVTVAYDKTVIDNFSYTFKDRGVYCIYAPSGRGKTTLLNVIAGLRRFKGEIENKGSISYLFQDDRLLPWLSAEGNISVVEPDKQKAQYYMSAFGVSEFADKLPGELSGGMKRRTALVRCLAFNADIYLLDEPLRGLDEVNAGIVREEIRRLGEEKLVIVVTHDESDASLLQATRILL